MFTFREIEKEDLARIKILEDRAFEVGPYSLLMLRYAWKESIGLNILAEEGGNIAGYIMASPVNSKVCDIETIAVDPDYRRRGLGRELISRIETMMINKGYHYSQLEVRVMNEEAINLYKNCGYEVTGYLKNYYSLDYKGSKDALRMRKRLS